MIETLQETWGLDTLFFLIVTVALLFFAKQIKDKCSPYKIDEELTHKDNPAMGVNLLGYFLGVFICLYAVLAGPSVNILSDLTDFFLFGILSIIMLNLSVIINDKFLLSSFKNIEELLHKKNLSVGIAQAGTCIFTACIVAGAVSGFSKQPLEIQSMGELFQSNNLKLILSETLSTLYFFVIGQIILIIFTRIFQWLTPYDDQEEIKNNNVAAALDFAGILIALGIIMKGAMFGHIPLNMEGTVYLFASAIPACFCLLILRLLIDRLFLPKDKLNLEISKDKNTAAGMISLCFMVGFALVILALFPH